MTETTLYKIAVFNFSTGNCSVKTAQHTRVALLSILSGTTQSELVYKFGVRASALGDNWFVCRTHCGNIVGDGLGIGTLEDARGYLNKVKMAAPKLKFTIVENVPMSETDDLEDCSI